MVNERRNQKRHGRLWETRNRIPQPWLWALAGVLLVGVLVFVFAVPPSLLIHPPRPGLAPRMNSKPGTMSARWCRPSLGSPWPAGWRSLGRCAAAHCHKAGADLEAIPAWIEEGRRRRTAARMPPMSGGLHGG